MALAKRDIPNALTILRLVLAVVFFIMLALASPDDEALLIASALLFAIAALTDALDGYLARRWNAVSAFGRIMDPFADKILVLGGFVMLAAPNFSITPPTPPIPPTTSNAQPDALHITAIAAWMPVLILARELLITSIRGVYEARGIDFSASASGKAKMVAQSIAIPAILLITAFHPSLGTTTAIRLNTGIAWFVVVLTALSAAPYLVRAAQQRAAIR